MKITLNSNTLKAALTHSAIKDIRYYLNGVCLEVQPESRTLYTFATDGHRLAAFRESLSGEDCGSATFQLIIPNDVIKTALKVKTKTLELVSLENGSYVLGNQVFNALDGKFPDVRRVIQNPEQCSNEATDFNWKYLSEADAAICTFYGLKVGCGYTRVTFNGNSSATVTGDDNNAIIIVMPIRSTAPSASAFNI